MCADLTLARQMFGYKPHFTLAEGLRLTIERDSRFQTPPPDQST
jgi:nucleoside-diphosphate-sugar epimerase